MYSAAPSMARDDSSDEKMSDVIDAAVSVASDENSEKNSRSGCTVIGTKSITINDLPDDSLLEVLYRLPSESAHRCICLSKRFCSLITSPQFRRGFVAHAVQSHGKKPFTLLFHRKHSDRKRTLILATPTEPESKSPQFSFNFLPGFPAFDTNPTFVLACCNDLILCTNRTHTRGALVYYVCNPFTRNWVELPRPPRPMLTSPRLGLVHDEENDRFRVVHIVEERIDGDNELKVEIFSSETGMWSGLNSPCAEGVCCLATKSVAHRGKLYWYTKGLGLVEFDPFNNDGNLNVIDNAVNMSGTGFFTTHCLGACAGFLRISHLFTGAESVLKVWELNSERQWDLKHQVCIKDFHIKNSSLEDYMKERDGRLNLEVMAFDPHDGEIVYLLVDWYIVLCHLVRETLEIVSEEAVPKKENEILVGHTIPIVIVSPWWPTSVPRLS